jgi:hypothetical protein
VPELSGRELLHEWRRLMDSVMSSSSAAGRSVLPHALLAAMQRQLELLQEIIERERRLQSELAGRLVAPVDAVFDLLEVTGATLRRQAEALEVAGRALEESAGLMKGQAEIFERTISTLRQPAELAKAAAGLNRQSRTSPSRKSPSRKSPSRKSETRGPSRQR